jgi:hypothetical protein
MDESTIKQIILDTMEASLDAQLRAIRRLKSDQEIKTSKRPKKGWSQVDMAYDVLHKAQTPLHISEIIARIDRLHGQGVDRESLVSALTKKVRRGIRFVRTDKNVFGLIEFGT